MTQRTLTFTGVLNTDKGTGVSPIHPFERTIANAYDVIVVGAGISGIYAAYLLHEAGFTFQVIEAGGGVGGTWYWNRYPGARCDVESLFYCYTFSEELDMEWDWTERYPTQPELERYLNHVIDKFDLRRYMNFNTRVVSADFDDAHGRWKMTTDHGDVYDAQFVVLATGNLSTPKSPDIPHLDQFRGPIFHAGRWPEEGPDLVGLKVGVVGTGSSGIQIVSALPEIVDQLYVFQRTPSFSMPACNYPLDDEYKTNVKSRYSALRQEARMSKAGLLRYINDQSALEVTAEERKVILDERWAAGGGTGNFLSAFNDTMVNPAANDLVAAYVRERIRETVRDPDTAERLCPTGYPIGSRRAGVDIGYFESFNLPNVHLVDVREDPIAHGDENGLVLASGASYDLDVIVFATGYDAMTGSVLAIDIRGRDGVSIRDAWKEGPQTYLGLCTAGFPNLFVVTGPGSPSVLANMVLCIEHHIEWITQCLVFMRENSVSLIEPELEAQQNWVRHVDDLARPTLFYGANSWYTGANVSGKPRVFMPYVGGFGTYRERTAGIAEAGYKGFVLERGDKVQHE
jgi:cyclohexanone monooxygenase